MFTWFVRVLVWSVVVVGTFVITLATTTGSVGTVEAVPSWAPVATVALLFAGITVVRRGLGEQPDL